MRSDKYSSVNPENGNVTWNGPLSIEKGDHSNMPKMDLPDGFERGHVNASSLGGNNTRSNVVAQHADVNHGAYYDMENAERSALKNGVAIDSTKVAIVDGKPGDVPNTFLVSDNLTFPDGHTESIHHSFTNASYAEQQAWNDCSAALPGTFDAPNPGDGLRANMSAADYASLMESTDAALPSVEDDYAAADFSGLPGAELAYGAAESSSGSWAGSSSADADISAGDDSGASCDPDD